MISSGTPQTKPRLTLCKTEIHLHHLHASFFSFSITVPRFFFSKEGQPYGAIYNLYTHFSSQIPGIAGLKRQGWG